MALRRKQCRDHGGIFSYHPHRGRQPVRCKPEYPCDRADTESPMEMKERTSPIGIPNRFEGVDLRTAKQKREAEAPHPAHATSDGAYLPSTASPGSNPCLPLAKAAKERLVTVGWVVQGRGWFTEAGGHAQITASRGDETLSMEWENGEVVSQIYAMEFLNPVKNNYPRSNLHFDPDELTDSELVRMIKGMKVTWHNTIAGSSETAIVGGTVTVEHIFRDNGDEDNSKRIVKFIDHGGGGFRAFHVSALLKVG